MEWGCRLGRVRDSKYGQASCRLCRLVGGGAKAFAEDRRGGEVPEFDLCAPAYLGRELQCEMEIAFWFRNCRSTRIEERPSNGVFNTNRQNERRFRGRDNINV
jgi:hypothetical protein